MASTPGKHEQDKVRAARNNFCPGQKRKISTGKDIPGKTTSTTSPMQSVENPESKKFKPSGTISTKPSEVAPKMAFIVRFYDGEVQARDPRGRTQEDILGWSDAQLESCHNYIQMLFPVPEGSAFNWEAPIIDRQTMDTFLSRQDLRDRLRRSFERMLEFYGFTVEIQPRKEDTTTSNPKETSEDKTSDAQDTTTSKSGAASRKASSPPGVTSHLSSPTYRIVRGVNFRKNSQNWVVRFDHNHLRITRILRCLRVLGLQMESEAFFKALKEVYDDPAVKISERSLMYWTRAVVRPLYIAPDDSRIEWLKDWQEQQEMTKN